MPRPTTKIDLINAANDQFNKLQKLIISMTDEQQNAIFTFADRDKNLRDVLTHLYEWHQLLLNWINANQKGIQKSFLPEPYNWKTYPQMNIELWKKHQKTSLMVAKKNLEESHKEVIELIEKNNDDELFKKKYFTWTGTTNLGSYCISSTSSHYDWAIKKIKKHIKNRHSL